MTSTLYSLPSGVQGALLLPRMHLSVCQFEGIDLREVPVGARENVDWQDVGSSTRLITQTEAFPSNESAFIVQLYYLLLNVLCAYYQKPIISLSAVQHFLSSSASWRCVCLLPPLCVV